MAFRPCRSVSTFLVFLGLALVAAVAGAQEGAAEPAPEDLLGQVISTESFGLFPVEGSGVHAQLQVAERAEGGTRLVLSLPSRPNGEYRAALYEGDCGPDRPLVLELAPFGIGGDPFVSTTDTEIPFETITQGDHFAYLFAGETIDVPDTFGLDGEAVACGEVGAGANE